MSETIGAPETGFGLAWDGGQLAVTDQVAQRVARKRLSPSTAKAMEGCPARHVAEKVLPRNEDPFAPAPLGTSGHTVLERLYLLPPEQRTRETVTALIEQLLIEVKDPVPATGHPGIPADRHDEWKLRVAHHINGIWTIENPAEIRVAHTEIKIDDVWVAGVPFNGTVDRVQYDANDRLILEDYKTGKQPEAKYLKYRDAHGDQLRIYNEAFVQLRGEDQRPVKAFVLYTQFGTSRSVSLTKSAMSKTLGKFAQSWVDLNAYVAARSFPTVTSGLCGYCPLVSVCPAAETAGKTAQIEGLPSATDLGIPSARVSVAVPDAPPTALSASDNHQIKDKKMTMLREDKPWEPMSGGTLNPNSYSAVAAFAITSMAVELLHKGNQVLKPSSIKALAATLSYVVETVQEEISDSRSMQDGLHTRLRGALYTVLELEPAPFGATTAEWETWVTKTIARVGLLARASVELWESGASDKPWTVLGIDPHIDITDTAADFDADAA